MKKSAEERMWLYYQRLARRAKKGLKVPQEFLDCAARLGLLAVKGMKSTSKASQLSEMIHSHENGLSSIQEYLNEHPITAFELLNLITLERAKGESELERAIKSKNSNQRDHQVWKRETVKPKWDEWQQQPELYKSKKAFAANMLSLESCPLKNADSQKAIETISDWCRKWERGDNQSNPTYDDMKAQREMRLEVDRSIKKHPFS